MSFFDYFRRYELHLEREVEQLRFERDMYRSKCERMELAIMPLTSPAGKAYAQDGAPRPRPRPAQAAPPRAKSWLEVQAEHAKQLEQEDLKELARKDQSA